MKIHGNKGCSNSPQQNKRDPLAQITVGIKTVQQKVAYYLQLKTEQLSIAKKKISLLLFSFLCGGCSIAVMLYSFIAVGTPVSTQRITVPKYAIKHYPRLKIRDSLISHEEYARVKQFRHYLEQLEKSTAGRKVYDSLMQARPFLLDSIHLIDSIYLTQ